MSDTAVWLAMSSQKKLAARVLIVVGAVSAIIGVILEPQQAWPALLINGFYWLALSVVGVFFIATQRLSGARWSASLRRVPEALMAPLPIAGAIMLAVIILGRGWIYPWARTDAFVDVTIAGAAKYLQPNFVFARTLGAFVLWVIFAGLFRRTSLMQDVDPSLVHHQRLNRLAAIFLIVFALTFTFGSFDWLVSLDPKWFSTMFAVYVFAGSFVQGIAAITLIVVSLRPTVKAFVSKEQLHDLGKLLFAFSTFWAYIWVCQYLLIWYSNLPDEVPPYVRMTTGKWLPLFLINLAVNWAVPFLVLLSLKAKRSEAVLRTICIVLLCGHWLDLYLLIMPSLRGTPGIGVYDVLIAGGCLGLFASIVLQALARAPLVPINDPFLIDSLRLEHS